MPAPCSHVRSTIEPLSIEETHTSCARMSVLELATKANLSLLVLVVKFALMDRHTSTNLLVLKGEKYGYLSG